MYACMLSHFLSVQLFATPWTVAHQAPLSMAFSRQKCRSDLPCPPPGDLPDPEIKLVSPVSPALQADSLLGDLPDPGIEPASLMSPALAGGFFTSNTRATHEAPRIIWGLIHPKC